MAKKHTVEAVWTELDPATHLTDDQRTAYDAYKACYRAMKAQRLAFEEAMQEGVEEGKRMICSYNFGKLKVDIVPDERKAKDAPVVSQSLAAFLAQRQEQGLRV